MHQLFYVSSARNGITSEDIADIIKSATKYNIENELTGILLYRGGIFLQLLEGDEMAIKSLFETKIKTDNRHSNIVEFFYIPAETRLFNKWSMAFLEVSEFDIKMVNQILSWNKLISKAKEIDNNLILQMLESFKGRL